MTERRDRERRKNEPDRPAPEEVLDLLHRVRPEVARAGEDVGERAPDREDAGNAEGDDQQRAESRRLLETTEAIAKGQ